MGMIAKELGRVTPITATAVGTADALVTNATTKDTIITKITAYNSHSAAVTLTMCRVQDNAGSVGTADANDVFWSQAVAAGDTIILGAEDISCPLTDTNDTLQVYASSASKINIFADGYTLADQS